GARDFVPEVDREGFANWLTDRYGTLDALDTAWNIYPREDRTIISDFEDAEDVLKGDKHINYGAVRDFMKYQAEKAIGRAKLVIDLVHELDPSHPISTGSHQLFANQAHLRWDIARWARIADIHFSSIHLSWHFEPVEGEVDRPVYMQARLTRDYFKGGWTSAYETTGGAVQYSGGYGNAMTPGLMRRLMLNYLAAGHQNIAFWTWNHRPGGWEAGEYGLTTLSGAISDWATEAAGIARAMDRYHAELWDAQDDPRVGLLQNWDTEAILEKEPERHDVKESRFASYSTGTRMQASRARIGAARALINHHIPFEYVTEPEILEGIAPVYPLIYAPHMRAASTELMDTLLAYVEVGGQLVADVQFAFMDPWGKLHEAGPDGPQARLFGAYIDTIHDARTAEVTLNGLPIEGFYGDLVPATGKILARFDNGKPAITEARIGRGRALLLAFDPGMLC
ncbi:MAG: beta-galactosidase, partial [Anaerolineae bacterium]